MHDVGGQVDERTACLIAHWQVVGFCHGVMNTDNMSILGLTLDYGPFGFMEAFNPGHVCNHSDDQGRYAYENQPYIGLWNCARLAQALTPLIDAEKCNAALARYEGAFVEKHASLMRAKLGLTKVMADDASLINDLLAVLAENRADYTIFFRTLSGGDAGAVRDRMVKTGLLEHVGEDHLYASIASAVAAFQAHPAPAEELPASAPEPS